MFGLYCIGFLVFALNSANLTSASRETWFEYCDHLVPLGPDKALYINSPFYPRKYPSGSSCRYAMTAPLDYEINIQCNIDIDKTFSDCDSEHFLLSTDGARNLTSSQFFCGKGYIQRKSLFRTLVIAYTSSSANAGGLFTCLAQTQKQSCECGWTIPPKEVVIGNRQRVEFNEYPMLVGIVNASSEKLMCGGTIVSHRHVMTAASCFQPQTSAKDILIRVQDHSQVAENGDPLDITYAADTIIQHPRYEQMSRKNDIAIVLTKINIEWTLGVGPACLPLYFSFNPFADEPAEIVGWTRNTFMERTANSFRKISVNITDNSDCLTTYAALDSTHVCTSAPSTADCLFEAGLPVMIRKERLYVVGVTGMTNTCDLPNLHTRVTSHLSWIRFILGDGLCRK